MPTKERTPQRIGAHRLTFGKANRRAIIVRQVASALDAHVAHAQLGLLVPTGRQFLTACESQLGKPYCAYGCRCEVSCWCHDCSGLPCYANNVLGLPHLCLSSFGFAELGQQLGLGVSEDFARHNPGCLAIRNPWGSPSANGANGHIVVMVGDGTDATVEEKGTHYGCVRDHEANRGFSYWMKPPGINMTPLAPPAQKVEPMLILDPKHSSHPARTRSASIDAAGNIRLGNGAHVAGDGARKTVNGVLVVIPNAQGAPFLGVAPSGGGFTLQFLQHDASFADFHYEFVA